MGGLQLSAPALVAPVGDRVGEAATWSAADRAVYWCDINRFLIHRYRLEAHAVESWTFDEPVVALGLTTDPARLLVALGSRLVLWSPATDSRRDHGFRLDGWPALRLNDGRPDPAGRFWVGSMRNNVGPLGEVLAAGGTDGRLFRIEGTGASVWREGIGVSNTLCWSPDRKKFYFADTLANIVWEHDCDLAAGSIGEPRMFFEGFERGWPDGSTMDADGYLWNCRFGGGCIVRVAPDGSIDRVIEMPVTHVTTCTFGGDDLTTLFVTTASAGAPEAERLAGSLFAIATNVKGQAENRFRLG